MSTLPSSCGQTCKIRDSLLLISPENRNQALIFAKCCWFVMTPIIYASLSCLCSKIKFQSDGSCICFNSGSQLPWSCSFCLCWHWASFFIFTILTVIQHQCFLVEFRIFLSFSCRSHCFFFLNILFHLNLSMYFVFFIHVFFLFIHLRWFIKKLSTYFVVLNKFIHV